MSSQGGQDKWVLEQLGGKKYGYYIDSGAASPYTNSNTRLLEFDYNWSGMLIEPRIDEYQALLDTRLLSNKIVHGALIGGSMGYGELIPFFINSKIPDHSSVIQPDSNVGYRKDWVPSWKIGQLLQLYKAPRIIDYWSLDVEGSELDVLRTFPWRRYRVRCISVEHNNNPEKRSGINQLLLANGYKQVDGPADTWWDDFYVLKQQPLDIH